MARVVSDPRQGLRYLLSRMWEPLAWGWGGGSADRVVQALGSLSQRGQGV